MEASAGTSNIIHLQNNVQTSALLCFIIIKKFNRIKMQFLIIWYIQTKLCIQHNSRCSFCTCSLAFKGWGDEVKHTFKFSHINVQIFFCSKVTLSKDSVLEEKWALLRTHSMRAGGEKAALTSPQCFSEDTYFHFSLKWNRCNLSPKDSSKRNRILLKAPCLHNISYTPRSPAIFHVLKLLDRLRLEYSVSLKIK